MLASGMTTTEVVRATDANPFLDLQRPDGTWSLRECQEAGRGLHAEYRDLKNARDRGYSLVAAQWGEAAAQAAFVNVPKSVEVTTPTGGRGVRQIQDYDCQVNALGLMATCQKSDLPDIDGWFVMAGLEKLFAQPEQKIGMTNLTATDLAALSGAIAALAPEAQLAIVHAAMTPEPVPTIEQRRAIADLATAQHVAPQFAQLTQMQQDTRALLEQVQSERRTLYLERHGVPGYAPPQPSPLPAQYRTGYERPWHDPDPGGYPKD